MKKKLFIPLVAVLALVILGSTLLLTKPEADSQNPTAPSLYPRPETPTSPTATQRTTEDQTDNSTTPTTTPQNSATQPDSTSTDIPEIPDSTIVSEDGDVLIVYNGCFDLDVYKSDPADSITEHMTGSNVGETIRIGLLSRTTGKLRQLQVDVCGTEDESINISPENLTQTGQHITIVGAEAAVAVGTLPLADLSAPVAMTLAGIDWNEALQRYNDMVQADETFWRSPTTPGNLQALRDAQAAYEDYIRLYQESAEASPQLSPEFEAVLVEIDLSQVAVGTVIDTVVLQLGDETYTLSLGQIRICASREEEPGGFGSSGRGYQFFYQYRVADLTPWDDGNFSTILDFSATENMILNRVEVLTDNGTVATGAWIRQIDKQTWMQGMEKDLPDDLVALLLHDKKRFPDKDPNYWDCKSPYYVNAGDLLCMDISFYDPAAHGAYYHGAVYYALHYTTAQGDAVILAEAELRQPSFNWVELYYTHLENLDLSAYYNFLNHGGSLAE